MGSSSSKVPVAEPQPVAGGRTAPPGAGDKVTATVPKVSIEPTATQPTIQKLIAKCVSIGLGQLDDKASPAPRGARRGARGIEPTATQPTSCTRPNV